PHLPKGHVMRDGRRLELLASACLALAAACGGHHESAVGGGAGGRAPADAADNPDPPDAAPRPYGCSGVDPSGRPAICDVAHVAFRVSDLAAARSFYGAYLGFEEPFAVSDKVAVFKINDSQYIELHEEPAPPPPDVNFQLKNIGFYTSDAAGLLAYYAAKGISVPTAVSKNLLGNTSFTVVDQDGHGLEWLQYEPDSQTGVTRGQGMPATRLAVAIHHTGVTIADAAQADAFYDSVGLVPSST